MRVALGVAVFSGMLGVTIFGIFFTPVFYVVIRWFTERKAAAPRPDARKVLVETSAAVDGTHPAKHGVFPSGQVESPNETD
jgi:hypothetical protein